MMTHIPLYVLHYKNLAIGYTNHSVGLHIVSMTFILVLVTQLYHAVQCCFLFILLFLCGFPLLHDVVSCTLLRAQCITFKNTIPHCWLNYITLEQ